MMKLATLADGTRDGRPEEGGIDFAGGFGVIVDEVPLGLTAREAARHSRLMDVKTRDGSPVFCVIEQTVVRA